MTPAAQMVVRASILSVAVGTLDVDALSVDPDHLASHAQFDAQALQGSGRLSRELVAEGGQGLGAPVHQDHPHRGGLEGAELPAKTTGGQLSHLTGQLDPGGPGPDHHDGQPALLLDGVGHQLGHFEGAEDAAPELEGVIEGLHPRSEEGELVVPEVGLGHAGGDDQAVVGILDGHPVRHRGVDHLALEVEAGHLGQLHPHVLRPTHDVSKGRGDLAWRQHAGRRLVEERLEEMMIATVDQRHVDRFTPQEAGGREAPEPPADDDHPMTAPGGTGRGGIGCDGHRVQARRRPLTTQGCSA